MKLSVKQIKESISNGKDPLRAIERCALGKVALVVSAGPSSIYWEDVYNGLDGRVLVACVKQAKLSVRDKCDLHFVNPYNHQKYKGSSRGCFTVFCDVQGSDRVFGSRDLVFTVTHSSNKGIEDSLAVTRNFEDWILSKSGLVRPWGPGIMHEAVLYTLLHMGFSDVITVGWDIADESGKTSHFYDDKGAGTGKLAIAKRKLNSFAKKNVLLRTPWFFLRHHLGLRYNFPAVRKDEVQAISSSLPSMLEWFDTQGMRIHLVSDSHWILGNCRHYASPTSELSKVCKLLT